jgi:hypothetical protein
MHRQGTVTLTRVKWLPTYRGRVRWEQDGARDLGWIALVQHGSDLGALQDGVFDKVEAKCRTYSHRLYEKNGALYVIGDCRNYPVAYPLYRVSIDEAA